MSNWLKRRRSSRTVQRAVNELSGEEAADLCRRMARIEDADKRVVIMLAIAGQRSQRPGDARAMAMYADALRAGRRIKYMTAPVRFNFVHVPEEMVEEIEEALKGDTYD